MPAFTTFLTDLFETGHARVPLIDHAEANFTSARAQEILAQRAQLVGLSLPQHVPEFNLAAALEAAHWMFLACQLYVDRSHTADAFAQAIESSAFVQDHSPSAVYSVDLCLSFLPDLYRHAHQHAPADPLMRALTQLATDWPLSSVGIPDLTVSPELLDPWFEDLCLRQLYLDRIVTVDDASRLNDERVVQGIRESVGLYRDTLLQEDVRSALLEQGM